ncbi:MAG: MurR/RpiR family transcriptional regulator [Kineosporiaceae bacterium]|nr:MurR/RpiR family transcriptional regulator [Aeromicrobium sp.]
MSKDLESGPSAAGITGSENVSDLISDRLSDLRAAERKVARALIADYPTAGLGTVASLAHAAGVSGPSVVRFVTALGFDGFPALQDALKDELRLRSEGPLGNIVWASDPGSHSANLVQGAETMATNAVQSLKAIPPQELERAIALLADSSRKVFITGGRYSNSLARHLAINLETIRPKVRFVEHPFGSDLSTLISLGTRDIYVLFDFHRYQSSTVELARNIRRRGATIVLVTDERMSPAASKAQVVIPINVSAPSPFYTFSGGTMLMELLVLAVLQELGDKGREYLARWDATRQRELVTKPD